MRQQSKSGSSSAHAGAAFVQRATSGVGKRTLVEQSYGSSEATAGPVRAAAERGIQGGGSALPHLDLIQRSFGEHDVTGVSAHVGGPVADACEALGARAYATGASVAFAGAPDLHTAAHEAAHVVQQRSGVQIAGGVGRSGDEHERAADAVADRVVRGESAADLLGVGSGGAPSTAVQRQDDSQGNEGYEQARWIATLRDSAKLRAGAALSHPILLEFPNFDTPLYYVGHWKNDEAGASYDPGDNTVPAFPLRWLEAEFRHPDWSGPVRGWMHSGVTHYPGQILSPADDVVREVAVSGAAVPATSGTGGTGNDATTGDATTGDATTGDATTGDATTGDATTGDATTGDATTGDATTPDAVLGEGEVPALQEPDLTGDVPPEALVIIGAGLDAPYVNDAATPRAMLAQLPPIQPFVLMGQGNGVNFHSSPNLAAVVLSSRVSPVMAVIGITRGRFADYATFEYLHQLPGGTVRRSDIWLICEFEGGTYFVHAGATLVTDGQLAAALGQEPPEAEAETETAEAESGDPAVNLDDWTEQGEHLATLPESPAPDPDMYQGEHGFAPDELIPSGYVPAGGRLAAATAQAAVPLKIAPMESAPHLPPLLAQGTGLDLYGLLPGDPEPWFRARAVVEAVDVRYGWVAASRLADAESLVRRFGATLEVAARPSSGGAVPLAGVGTIHVVNPNGADAFSSAHGGTLVAHLAAGFAITQVYEVVVGQAVTRPAGLSSQWLRVGLTRESSLDETPAYLSVLDTSFATEIAPTSGGAGSELIVTVTNPDVYVYSTPAFDRDAQLITASLPTGHPLSVLWEETALDGGVWLRVRTDTNIGTLEGYVASTRTSYTGGAPTPPVHQVESTDGLPGGGARDAVITAEQARIRPNAAAGPSDTPLGYLSTGARITVLLQYQTQDLDGVVETDLGASMTWLYVQIPEDQVVEDSAGNPLANPPRRGWIHASATSLGGTGGEALGGRPTNEGADELAMPGTPPPLIDRSLTPGMVGPEVQMAKVQLVRRRFMNTSEYNVIAPDTYSAWTIEAVRSFQTVIMQRYDDQADGILSPQVWQALFQSAEQQSHMTLDAVEAVLAGASISGDNGQYQWDDVNNNPYAYENFGSGDYWGPRIPGGECTWFVRSVLTKLPVRLGSGSWPREAAHLIQPTPERGDAMCQGSHVAIVTAVSGDGATLDLIECNWKYSRAVDTRSVAVEADMTFLRPQ